MGQAQLRAALPSPCRVLPNAAASSLPSLQHLDTHHSRSLSQQVNKTHRSKGEPAGAFPPLPWQARLLKAGLELQPRFGSLGRPPKPAPLSWAAGSAERKREKKKRQNTIKRLGKFYSLLNFNSFLFGLNTINISVIAFNRLKFKPTAVPKLPVIGCRGSNRGPWDHGGAGTAAHGQAASSDLSLGATLRRGTRLAQLPWGAWQSTPSPRGARPPLTAAPQKDSVGKGQNQTTTPAQAPNASFPA